MLQVHDDGKQEHEFELIMEYDVPFHQGLVVWRLDNVE